MSVIVATLLKGWRGGDILWLIDVVGDWNSVREFVKRLNQTAFSGRHVKTRRADAHGTTVASVPGATA